MYLSTVLDNFSRYIICWKLCPTMKTGDVTDTLNMALVASGCNRANMVHQPPLLSDNGASYISGDLADYIKDNGISHVRGAPYQPQTQGKIERWHQTLKNLVLLENDFLPRDLERQIEGFVEHYNYERYHEALKRHNCRCLLRQGSTHHQQQRKDQEENNRTSTLAIPQSCRLISANKRSKLSLYPDPNLGHFI